MGPGPSWKAWGWVRPSGLPRARPRGEGAILSPDAHGQHRAVQNSENGGEPFKPENQRKHGNLPDHHRIIRMREESVRSRRDQGMSGQNDDACCPARAERPHDPETEALQSEI